MLFLERIQAALAEALRKHQAGQIDEAFRVYATVLEAMPANADAHHLRGIALYQRGEHGQSGASIGRALAIDSGQAAFHLNLAQVAMAQQRPAEAAARLRRGICLSPVNAHAFYSLGVALDSAGNMPGAARSLQRSAQISGSSALVLGTLAAVLQNLGVRDAAVVAARRALALAPDSGSIHNCLAVSFKDLGLVQIAVRSFRWSLALEPSAAVRRNLLLTLHYLDDLDPGDVIAEHRRWAAGLAVERRTPTDIDRSSNRPLAIGYLSGDLRTHVVGRNLIGLVESHDKQRFQVTIYSNVPRPDAMTERFRAAARRWRDVHPLSDLDLARQIAADRIDILVCCAGHVGENRLEVASYKPAPIQVSLHDVTSSGLPTVDYWLTDSVLHPPETRERFTESLYRLPCFYLHQPIENAPDPGAPPAEALGHITFGSCNNPAKLSPQTIEAWAAAMRDVPGSRLALWHFDAFRIGSLRDRLLSDFSRHGIAPERLHLEGSDLGRKDQHLRFLQRVDIGLDPLPFNGATTTFEQLWMGIPVVTVAGDRFTARVGASMLTALGLAHLVADDPQDMPSIAAALAADQDQRRELRETLRARVQTSVLCDGVAYTRSVEQAYTTMWRKLVGG